MSKLRIENLEKTFIDADHNLTVLKSLSYTFADYGSYAIVGKSGVGKSTLLYLLGGLELPSSGGIWIGDTDLTSLDANQRAKLRSKEIGFVFQFHHLLPEFSALENVCMPLLIQGTEESKARDSAASCLERVGLSDRFDHRPGELSGGEQQRVAIARALVTKPNIILADEPTGNLDDLTASEVTGLLLDMNKELNNLLIIVTHNKELATKMEQVLEMLPGGQLSELGESS